MNNIDAVITHRRGTVRNIGVAIVLLAAVAAGISFVMNPARASHPVAGSRTASAWPAQLPPAAGPSPGGAAPNAPSTPDATLSSFVCGSTTFNGQHYPVTAFVNAIRSASHAGYERLTIQFANGQPISISLLPQASPTFTNSPRGDTVTLGGGAGLLVVIRGADAHTSFSGPTAFRTGGSTLLEVRRIEDFEGQVQLGLGLSKAACYHAFILGSPSRLVIDVHAG